MGREVIVAYFISIMITYPTNNIRLGCLELHKLVFSISCEIYDCLLDSIDVWCSSVNHFLWSRSVTVLIFSARDVFYDGGKS